MFAAFLQHHKNYLISIFDLKLLLLLDNAPPPKPPRTSYNVPEHMVTFWSRAKKTPAVTMENLDWLLKRHHKQITDTSVSN
jgi:hypothetical protein